MDEACLLLKHHAIANRPAEDRALPAKDEGSADIGMTGEGDLGGRREDANAGRVRGIIRRKHEGRFRIIELGGDLLQQLLVDTARIRNDRQRISAEARIREHIHGDIVDHHAALTIALSQGSST